jgi:copper transport protein
VSATVDDLLVSMIIRPNRPGRNFVSVAVFDTRRPAPAPIEGVVGRFTSPDGGGTLAGGIEEALTPLGDGQYETAIDIPAGVADWQIGVGVERPGLPKATFDSPWTVPPEPAPAGPPPSIISNQPLAPLVDAAAVGLTLGIVLVAAGAAVRRWGGAASAEAVAANAAVVVPIDHRRAVP